MNKIKIKKLDLKNIVGIKNLVNYTKIKDSNQNNLIINKNSLKKSKSMKSFEKNNTFNKTSLNKEFLSRKKVKEVSFKLDNIEQIKKVDYFDNDNESKKEFKKLINNFSPISKESTMYKTRQKFFSSNQLTNKINNLVEEKSNNSKRRKSDLDHNMIRPFSANNSINKIFNKNNNNIFGDSQFITALSPFSAKNKSNKSFYFKKINAEKKFLTFFDIKKIYFLDKKVYKPNKEFEKKIIKLKNKNSDKFIQNFNLNSYKIYVLNLFQKHVSHQNLEKMKKNFDLITKAWKWKDNLKYHTRKRRAASASQTEREMKYNQDKIDRENRIKSKNIKNKKDKKDKKDNKNEKLSLSENLIK